VIRCSGGMPVAFGIIRDEFNGKVVARWGLAR
jgi:hypothetical protein